MSDPFAEHKGSEATEQAALLCLDHPLGNLGAKASCKRAVHVLMLSYNNLSIISILYKDLYAHKAKYFIIIVQYTYMVYNCLL